MTKVLVALHKRADMSRDDFRRHWRSVHGPIALAMPGLRKYVQNHAIADGAPFDGLAEMWFDDAAAMQKALTSEAAQRAAADSANFLERTQLIMVEEAALAG